MRVRRETALRAPRSAAQLLREGYQVGSATKFRGSEHHGLATRSRKEPNCVVIPEKAPATNALVRSSGFTVVVPNLPSRCHAASRQRDHRESREPRLPCQIGACRFGLYRLGTGSVPNRIARGIPCVTWASLDH